MSKITIIAEIGECFNGDMNTAKEMISIAAKTGCDIAKFQTLDQENISPDDPEREWFEKISLNEAQINELLACGLENNIKVVFTPENVKTAKWLKNAQIDTIKIASSCADDLDLMQYVNQNFNHIIASTGMASLDEVNKIDQSFDQNKLTILHCISEYPTGPLLDERGLKALDHKDVNMNMMKILQNLFPHRNVGYSDHTVGILAPVVAASMGATCIEKHFTLDRKIPVDNFNAGREYLGTDHVLSVEPNELKEMVSQIREVESILGPYIWDRTPGEKILMKFLRDRFKENEL